MQNTQNVHNVHNIKEYKIIASSSINEINDKVNKMLDKGWMIHGSICGLVLTEYTREYLQVLVKYKSTPKKQDRKEYTIDVGVQNAI